VKFMIHSTSAMQYIQISVHSNIQSKPRYHKGLSRAARTHHITIIENQPGKIVNTARVKISRILEFPSAGINRLLRPIQDGLSIYHLPRLHNTSIRSCESTNNIESSNLSFQSSNHYPPPHLITSTTSHPTPQTRRCASRVEDPR
jgi:hypothetical protein